MKALKWVASCFLLASCQATGEIGDRPGAPENPTGPMDSPKDPPVLTPPPVACTTPRLGRRLLRRLTRSEYDRTVQDLLGVPSTYGARFAADTAVEGYDNHAHALSVAPLLADQLRIAAEELSTQATQDPAAITGCADTSEACVSAFIARFGERAFRRPLASAEAARYLRLYREVGEFREGVRWITAAMLQSPSFLYRSEIGAGGESGEYRLTSWEIASELSYFITGSMPDEELFRAARAGELTDPAAIEREARRLFHTPRARETLARFAGEWLELDRLADVPKDPATYPNFDAAARASLLTETNNAIARVVFEGSGTLSELLTAGEPGSNRAGLLSQGAVLAVHARPNSSSPVHRGRLVRERILCEKLPPPPQGIIIQPPALDPAMTGRERYAQHTTDAGCRGCHRLMDPIGFAFEHFDGIGRFRADENGLPIDDAGEIIGSRRTDATFQGVRGLAELLAGSADVRECFTEHWFRFAYGLSPEGELACVLEEIQATLGEDEQPLESLIVALMLHPRVRMRIGEEVMTADPPMEMPPATPPPPPPPPSSSEIAIDDHVDSRWENGHCHTVTVTNLGAAQLDWSITLRIEGTINQTWNAQASGNTGDVHFDGVSWNDVIPPGGSASFGYCAQL